MEKIAFLTSVSVFIFFSATAFATDRLVRGQYATIQAAIDASINGGTIIIADGTYTGAGNKNLDAKCDMQVFEIHRFDDFKGVTKHINDKLDRLIKRTK